MKKLITRTRIFPIEVFTSTHLVMFCVFLSTSTGLAFITSTTCLFSSSTYTCNVSELQLHACVPRAQNAKGRTWLVNHACALIFSAKCKKMMKFLASLKFSFHTCQVFLHIHNDSGCETLLNYYSRVVKNFLILY